MPLPKLAAAAGIDAAGIQSSQPRKHMKTNTPISPPSGPATGSFNGLHPESKFLAMGLAAVLAGTAFADSAVTSYEYMAPTSYAYADPNAVNLQSQSLAADLPAAPPEQIAAPPALPEHVSASIVGGSEVGGGSEVVFLGDAGNANHVVFSVDAQGRLQHNLGGRFGLASGLDLDAAAPGVQTLTIGQIKRLTYWDLDAVADDSVTGDAEGLDLGGGSLAISAGTVTIHVDGVSPLIYKLSD
jgi:hypothetical protein